jgi:flagellar motor switch protein FliN/FliY
MADQATPQDQAPPDQDDAVVQEALAEAQTSVNQIQQELATSAAQAEAPSVAAAQSGAGAGDVSDEVTEGLDLLRDVDLHVMIELGRTEMLVEDVLKLVNGSVVELDKLAGDTVDVYVNGRLVARGEVLVLNDNFCIRISEIITNLEEQAVAAAAEGAAAAASTN